MLLQQSTPGRNAQKTERRQSTSGRSASPWSVSAISVGRPTRNSSAASNVSKTLRELKRLGIDMCGKLAVYNRIFCILVCKFYLIVLSHLKVKHPTQIQNCLVYKAPCSFKTFPFPRIYSVKVWRFSHPFSPIPYHQSYLRLASLIMHRHIKAVAL